MSAGSCHPDDEQACDKNGKNQYCRLVTTAKNHVQTQTTKYQRKYNAYQSRVARLSLRFSAGCFG